MAKIAVIGPGAMGCLFAVRLARSGARVYLVDHSPERVKRLDQSGITVETGEGEIRGKVQVCAQVPGGLDLILVLTKSYSTASLRFPPAAPVLTLQNGLGNAEILASIAGGGRILAGTTTEAATLVAEGRVRHTAHGTTLVGAWTTCPANPVVELLGHAGFQTRITESPGQAIWEKVAINAGINPLTAILNIPNGRILEITEVRQLMRDLVVEAAKTAGTEGYRFDHSVVEEAERVCLATASNISSMLQDIRAGRPTEIEAISGEILRRATEAALPVPRTRAIYQLIRGLEQR